MSGYANSPVRKAHSISSLLDIATHPVSSEPRPGENEVESALKVPYRLVKKKSSAEIWDEVTKSPRLPSPVSDTSHASNTSSNISHAAEDALGVPWPVRVSPLSRKLSRSASLSPPPSNTSAAALPPASIDAAIGITWPKSVPNSNSNADDYFRMQMSNDRALEDADYRTFKPAPKMKAAKVNLTPKSKGKKTTTKATTYEPANVMKAPMKSKAAPHPRHVQRVASPPRITEAFHPVDMIRQEIIQVQPKPVRNVSHSDFIIERQEIRLRRRIGEGFFGVVWEGLWGSMKVAVKVMKHSPQSDDPKHDFFMSEVTAVSKLRHPNITVFYGVTEPPEPLIITELLDCSLHELLQHPSRDMIPESVVLRLLQDVAAGVNYLHTRKPSIIHRDISTTNVLCSIPSGASNAALVTAAADTSRPLAKLTDFGLSRNVDRYMTSCVGNLYYLAPEVFRGENYTESADVYSYSILMWEVLTQETPFVDMNPQSVAFRAAVEGLRPRVSQTIPPRYASLMTQCWHAQPSQRPPFASIVLELSTMTRFDEAAEALSQAVDFRQDAFQEEQAVYAEFIPYSSSSSSSKLNWKEVSDKLQRFVLNRVPVSDLIRRNILKLSSKDKMYLGIGDGE